MYDCYNIQLEEATRQLEMWNQREVLKVVIPLRSFVLKFSWILNVILVKNKILWKTVYVYYKWIMLESKIINYVAFT